MNNRLFQQTAELQFQIYIFNGIEKNFTFLGVNNGCKTLFYCSLVLILDI